MTYGLCCEVFEQMARLLTVHLVPVPETIADPDTVLTVPVVYIMIYFLKFRYKKTTLVWYLIF